MSQLQSADGSSVSRSRSPVRLSALLRWRARLPHSAGKRAVSRHQASTKNANSAGGGAQPARAVFRPTPEEHASENAWQTSGPSAGSGRALRCLAEPVVISNDRAKDHCECRRHLELKTENPPWLRPSLNSPSRVAIL